MDFLAPFGYPIQTYIWVLGLASAAGAVKYINYSVTNNHFLWFMLFKDMLSGALSGLMAFWLCESLGIGSPKNAMLITVAGTMGARAWEEFEQSLKGLIILAAKRHRGGEDLTPPRQAQQLKN